jgi:hypothetical protein
MISAQLVHLIRQLLLPLQRNVWYAVNITQLYNPTLQTTIQLNEEDCTTLMISTGIMVQKGMNIIISLQHLEFLKAALQENMVMYITRARLASKKHYFIAID